MYPRASPGGVPEAAAWHLPPPSGTVSVGVTGYGRDIGDDVTGQIEISGDIRYPEPHGNRPPPAHDRRRARGHRTDPRHRLPVRARRDLGPFQGVRRRGLPLRVLGSLEEPLGPLVHDEGLREPGEGARVPRARAVRRVSPAAIELRLRGPGGEPVDLWRTLVSHGFADLAPMSLDEEARTLDLTLRIPRGRPRRIRVGAGRRGRARVELLVGGAARDGVVDAVARGAAHALRLAQDPAPV